MTSIIKKYAGGIRGLILLAFIAFVALGLPDGLLGVGWPSIRKGFSIPLDSLGLLLATGTAGYLTSSFLNGKLISRFGVGGILTVSCALTGVTLIAYTLVPYWWMMVVLGILFGLGAGAIDAGLNTYVAANFNEKLMQWLHASYGIGVTLGPIIMTIGLNTFNSWRVGYNVVGGFQLFLAACFFLTLPLWKKQSKISDSDNTKRLTDYKTSYWDTFRQPRVWLSTILFFLYTGAEVSMGTWMYSLLTESRGIFPGIAGLWAGSYWATFTIGRFTAGLYTKWVKPNTLINGSLLGALIGTTMLWWNPSEIISLIGVGMIGLAVAPIFPGLMSGTSQRVNPRYAANTIGMQMSAAGIGAAAIPGLVGVLAKRTTLEIFPACLFILFVTLMGMYTLSIKAAKAAESGIV
jgi:fucose permease